MLPGAHVAHRAGPLAVARQPSCRQLVQGHALGATGEEPLRDARPPEHGLQRPDVEVLAGMRAAQEGDVGRGQVERLDAAGFEQRHRAERLDGAPKRHDTVRVPEDAEHPSARVDLDDVAAMDGLDDAVPDMAHEDRRGRPARGLRDARTGGCGRTARRCGGARGAARVAGARQGVRRHLHREHTAASWRPGLKGGGVITERWTTGSRPVDPREVSPRPRWTEGNGSVALVVALEPVPVVLGRERSLRRPGGHARRRQRATASDDQPQILGLLVGELVVVSSRRPR